MARKLGIKSDPLAGQIEPPSVMDGILERSRERGGRTAPEETIPPTKEAIEIDRYQDSKISSHPAAEDASLIDLVTTASTARHQALVQLGVRIPAEQKDRLEEAQIRLRKKGITNQGIVIAALDAALTQLEKEIEEM